MSLWERFKPTLLLKPLYPDLNLSFLKPMAENDAGAKLKDYEILHHEKDMSVFPGKMSQHPRDLKQREWELRGDLFSMSPTSGFSAPRIEGLYAEFP